MDNWWRPYSPCIFLPCGLILKLWLLTWALLAAFPVPEDGIATSQWLAGYLSTADHALTAETIGAWTLLELLAFLVHITLELAGYSYGFCPYRQKEKGQLKEFYRICFC